MRWRLAFDESGKSHSPCLYLANPEAPPLSINIREGEEILVWQIQDPLPGLG